MSEKHIIHLRLRGKDLLKCTRNLVHSSISVKYYRVCEANWPYWSDLSFSVHQQKPIDTTCRCDVLVEDGGLNKREWISMCVLSNPSVCSNITSASSSLMSSFHIFTIWGSAVGHFALSRQQRQTAEPNHTGWALNYFQMTVGHYCRFEIWPTSFMTAHFNKIWFVWLREKIELARKCTNTNQSMNTLCDMRVVCECVCAPVCACE